MTSNSYLVRRGARYHFRRRLPCSFEVNRPISIALGTSDPVEARCLVRRLAANWDVLLMQLAHKFERGHLTIDEQEALFKKGLKDELARATSHLTAPIGSIDPQISHHKIMAAAYRIVARAPHNAEAICADIVETEIDDSWSDAEVHLLWKTLVLIVRPMSVSRTDALEALQDLNGPLSEGAIREARAQILRGYSEAHLRSRLLNTDTVKASGRGVMALLDDALSAKASIRNSSDQNIGHLKNVEPDPPKAEIQCEPYAYDSIYARPSDLRFSEVIEPVLSALEAQRGWKKDNGQRLAVCERAAWICGDKRLRDWTADDAEFFKETMRRIPRNFKWGKLYVSGPMAEPFDEGVIPPIEAGQERSPRTINRDLSILQNVSRRLAKTHWKLKFGGGLEVDFLEHTTRIEDDPLDPDRMPWTPEHLRTLYSLPLWQGGGGSTARLKLPVSKKVWMDAAYWLPLIATYTGICREEGAGLEVDDFNFACEVPYVVVKPNELRGLKTKSRSRVIPLHPELLDMGLRQYVEAVAAEQAHEEGRCTPIFLELWSDKAKQSATGKKVPSKGGRRFYAIAWRYLADGTHGRLPLPETKDGKKADFHSQRTYNLSVLASPDVAQAILDRHMGHAAKGTGQKKYNRRSLAYGEVRELKERLSIMVREMPNVTSHIPRQAKVNLLHLRKRSRVGSAPGRDAQRHFCQSFIG